MKIKFGDNSLNLKVDGSLANIDRGPRGYSAYEIAVQEGFVGTEEEWLASLAGPEGKQGKDGERGIQGPRGQQGDKGDKGDKGDTGNDGHTPVKGVDYFTSEDIASLNIPYSLSDLSDDSAHRTVTDVEKSTWNNKYDKPSSGIPATDLSGQVQASLGKADTALQEHQDLTDYVKNTDFASSSKGGVFKTSSAYKVVVDPIGTLRTTTVAYTDYGNLNNSAFIGKGTLENVITGKELVDQDALVQSQEAQDVNIEENASNIDWLQTLVNQMPHVAGQGTDLSLESVLNYRLMKFLPQGVSKQESTTGKNLLNSITDTTTRNGITFTKNSDGTYTLNGTSTSDIDFNIATDIPLDLNTSYILSGSPNTASNTTYRIMGACTRENDSTTYIADNDGSGVTIPSSKMIRVYINVKNGKTLNNVVFKPMIRLATITDSTYEHYTGGIPAPNPSYPYPVNSVTGENSLIISNVNLFDGARKNVYFNNQKQFVSGLADSSTTNYIPAKEGDIFTIYTEDSSTGIVIASFDKDYNCLQREAIGTASSSLTHTCPANTKYIIGSNYIGMNTQTMLVKGSTAPTIYVEHEEQNYQLSLGNIELNSSPDGTIRDGIMGSSDVSYNLFNKNDVIKGNYQINSSHSLVSSNSNRVLFIPCKPNTTYTVSKKISNYFTIGFINEEPSVNISVTGYMRNPSLEYLTSTSDSDSKYLACWYYNTGETLTEQEILDSIQITEGSEAKPYFPYGQVGMWYKREYIGKIVLDGVTNKFEYKHTTIKSETKGFYRTSLPNKNLEFPNGSLGVALSDYFGLVSGTANNAFSNNESGMWWQQTGESVYFILEKTSLADANDWLATHNTTIYYPLAQYTDIPITDTTLINQLNDIYNNAHSYNGETNITTTYANGNEQMYLDIEALAKGGSITTETDPVFSASASSGITSSDISNWNNKADVEDIPDLTEYVKDTNYAGSTKGGVIRVNGNLGLSIDTSNGNLKTSVKTYAQYDSMTNNGFVGKGTLENVITGKNLADKNYVDTAIATAITNTLGGSY